MATERIDLPAAASPALLAAAAELIERDGGLDFFAAAPTTVRDALGLADFRIGGMGLVASTAVPILGFNRAMAVGADATSSDELDAAVAWLNKHAAPGWALQIAPPASEMVQAFVDKHGLKPSGGGWAKFVQTLPNATTLEPDATVSTQLVDHRTARSFGITVQRGFDLPDASAPWFEALVGRPGWFCFLATIDSEPAGAAATYVSHGAAWSGMAATLPDHRRRGVQGSLIAARLNAASREGAAFLTSETGRPAKPEVVGFSSYRNQLRSGSTEVYVRQNYVSPA